MGASWIGQLASFGVCLAFGVAGGIPALLFLRRARPIERALTDLTACVLILGCFILSVEFGCDGKFAFYNILAFALGLPAIPLAFKKIVSPLRASRGKSNEIKPAAHPRGIKHRRNRAL